MILPLLISFMTGLSPVQVSEETVADTLAGAVVVSSYKQIIPLEKLASPVSVIGIGAMESRGIDNIRDFSSLVPNLHIPDYGSAMTSSVYLRGFGSRMDNPVVGLYIDDIPVMNKNAYDFDMTDIKVAMLLRGPQSTLYGRNSMCGVMSLQTLSSDDFTGLRAGLEYGSAGTVMARASYYGESGFSLAAVYRHSDGFYTNYYDGSYADEYDAFNLRAKYRKNLRPDLIFCNVFSASLLGQGGYPYGEYDEAEDILHPVSYNDVCGYWRLNVTEGLKFKYVPGMFSLSSVTSLQYLSDDMRLDQDFTDASLFTLNQRQNEGVLTQEIVLKPEAAWRRPWWNWQTGFFGFARYNDMAAPVRFKKDGIDRLIVSNVNNGMQAGLPGASFSVKENEFDILSDFGIATYGAALYHESVFSLGKWMLTAGLRVDYEGASMAYDSRATVNYRLDSPELPPASGYTMYECRYDGVERNTYVEVMPKLSALYDAGAFKVFATVSRGYKAGGFNVQIFSDILQNRMMAGIMEDLGVYLDTPVASTGADATSYKPEKSLDTEIGMRFGHEFGLHRLDGELSFFHVTCTDQQITVFPPGMSTGRMMANVGLSRSCGAEAGIGYSWKGLSFSAFYGYCNARFVKYDDGQNDFSGNRIPYTPAHTLNVRASYRWDMDNDLFRSITASAGSSAAGRIWWNEANTLYQPFYCTVDADVRASFRWFDIYCRGENLTGTDYRTFYFKSVGKSFFQTGKPFRLTIGIAVEI